MLLRASSEVQGNAIDLSAVTQGSDAASGVPHEVELIRFAESAVRHDGGLESAREDLRAAMGDEAVVDAAAVVANFQRMVRIADAAGIPLDTPVAMVTADLREELGIDDFGSAERTPAVGSLARVAGRVLGKVLPRLMSVASKRMRDAP